MTKANLALSNSNTLLQIQLVHSEQVTYTELHSNEDLYNLRNDNDGIMDNVHSLRDTYSADVVVLLEETDFTGGLGYLLNTTAGSPTYAFSLTRVQQASWTYTTVHEIGHNMGCHHHKDQNVQPGPGLYDYSAGSRWTSTDNNNYCSVMTYESGDYFSDGINHSRIPYFSNPNIQYIGVPAGDVVDADNARNIRQIKSVIANYRGPIIEFDSHTIDDDNSTSSGDNDGLVEPGEIIEMPVTLYNSGTGDANNVTAVLSTTDADISITDANEDYGTITAGASIQCINDYDFIVSSTCPEKDVTFTLDITSDEGSWTDQFTVHVYAGQANPCDNTIPISNCGSTYPETFTGGGAGEWDNNSCGYSTPGMEQVYSFVAPVTGTYSITVAAASGYVDYSWQASSCGETGWTCIDDITSAGTYGSMSWAAGTTYYILLDDENSTTGTHQFYINCPASTSPNLAYSSHVIDDDNSTSSGDNDGLVEPGEIIEMPVTLYNSGTGDANNVTAVLSTTDADISITDANEDYGTITAGASIQCINDYDFIVSSTCPEKDVTFTLDITSDEGSWVQEAVSNKLCKVDFPPSFI